MTKHTTTAQIIDALKHTAGDITAAAKLLGLRREALYYRIRQEPDLKRITEEQRAGRNPDPAPPQAEAPSESKTESKTAETESPSAAESLPAGYTTADELLNHYRQLTEAARRELIPIAEGLKQEPERETTEPEPQTAEQVSTEPTGTASAQEPTATHESSTAPDPEIIRPLPPIAERIRRQDAANLAGYLRNHIAGYGLPRQYGAVIDYIKYLDKVMSGKA